LNSLTPESFKSFNGNAKYAKVFEYDGVVIGAGHNGMICAGYLASAARRLWCRKNMEVAGDWTPRGSQLSRFGQTFIRFSPRFDDAAMVQDLELEKFGIHYYKPDRESCIISSIKTYWAGSLT